MRFPLASASALIALGALLGTTAVPLIPSAWAEDQPAQQNAQPKPETSAPAAEICAPVAKPRMARTPCVMST